MKKEQRNYENKSVEIKLVFEGEPPTGLIFDTVQVIEEEIRQSQRAEMEFALEELDLPGYVKSVCRRRIESATGVSLRFKSARTGSVVLVAGVTALGYWILQNTIGETLKDAYKESGMHERLKHLLLSRLRRQTEDLGSALSGRLVRQTSDAPTHVSVNVSHSGAASVVAVAVAMSTEREQALPPTLEEWFES